MALANSLLTLLCSSSSFSQIHYRYRDFNYAPQIFSQPEPSSLAFSPIRNKFSELGNGMSGFSKKKNIVHASANDLNAPASSTSLDAGSVPIPVVLIDQDSDSDATIVQLSFGDRLGALINTMNALKDLGLAVAKGTVLTEGPVKQTKFFITRLDSGRKVEDPDMLERIRLTIINNLLKYHPESSERLAMGEAFGIKAPEKKLDVDIATQCACQRRWAQEELALHRDSRSTWIACRNHQSHC
ncbi:ACT DOMAIN-CONTAINING PROTEIN ACR12 [Salix purpurea]|uniref:ACT domain-containing protein ACR n=1 Tax=Salix purpurea TaxID=77065 RepID=A0A9Q0UCI4_SALPP|nr:ACT DOMAIN-CONTAINING PROTEIN ACR12 [Salix purpurea]